MEITNSSAFTDLSSPFKKLFFLKQKKLFKGLMNLCVVFFFKTANTSHKTYIKGKHRLHMTTWCAVMDAEQSLTLSKKLAVQVESKITQAILQEPHLIED